MGTVELLSQGFWYCMNPYLFALMLMGVAVGIVFGSIPGLSAMMAVALFLPVTFSVTVHSYFHHGDISA